MNLGQLASMGIGLGEVTEKNFQKVELSHATCSKKLKTASIRDLFPFLNMLSFYVIEW